MMGLTGHDKGNIMAIQKQVTWLMLNIAKAYIKIVKPADSDSNIIVIEVYSCKESKEAKQSFMFTNTIFVSDEQYALLFSEETLKVKGVTAKSQSYVYLKTLSDYSGGTDV